MRKLHLGDAYVSGRMDEFLEVMLSICEVARTRVLEVIDFEAGWSPGTLAGLTIWL